MKTTFGKQNYQILIGGIVLIILGYLLMIGGGSEDPNVFNPAIFDTQRITIAPMRCIFIFLPPVKRNLQALVRQSTNS